MAKIDAVYKKLLIYLSCFIVFYLFAKLIFEAGLRMVACTNNDKARPRYWEPSSILDARNA